MSRQSPLSGIPGARQDVPVADPIVARERVRQLLEAGYLKSCCGHGNESHAAAVRQFCKLH
jgi:hypothetical protein